jgi:hypothetical protein
MAHHSNKDYRKILFTNTTPMNNSDPATKERMDKSATILGNVKNPHNAWSSNDIVPTNGKNTVLPSTYFQNYKAIQGVIGEMRKDIVGKLENLYPDMKKTVDSKTSAFMHVRRGDYHRFGQALPKEYYQNALHELSKKGGIKKIYVLSDDLEWCRQQRFTAENVEIQIHDEPDELKALYLMSLCEAAAIISASTFSTWGAIFGAQKNRKPLIIYPKKWFMSDDSSVLEFPADKGWLALA